MSEQTTQGSEIAGPYLLPEEAQEPINSFSLVTYVPEPLGRFLDELRQELVPNCTPKAHVTILPPRPLWVPLQEAWGLVCSEVRDLGPIEIQATDVCIFDKTNVIYVEVGAGRRELERLHNALNRGPLEFEEPFTYHPHITLAQEINPDHVRRLYDLACLRWAAYAGSRRFAAETLILVQNTNGNQWLDLAHHTLTRPEGT